MFLFYYDDEPAPRSATAEIWLECGRRALAAIAIAAVAAATVLLCPAIVYLLGEVAY